MTISIIIPTYNAKELLRKNLPCVIAACETFSSKPRAWQLVVVDDASTDGTSSWLKKSFSQVTVVTNAHNMRFGQAVNRGVKRARGEIVVLLNNDVQPEKTFLKPLVKHFANPTLFAVGCLERNKEDGKMVLGGRGEGRFSRGFFVHWRAQDQTKQQTLWVAGGSGAFRKSIWQKLGGFDPLFRPAYEEDRDLCYNALKAGYSLRFEPNSIVNHIHETTNVKAFGKKRIEIMSFKNQLLLVWKNVSSLRLVGLHLLWLPYHLVMTTLRTRGRFLAGFLMALRQLPEALGSRAKAKRYWQKSDEAVLAQSQ